MLSFPSASGRRLQNTISGTVYHHIFTSFFHYLFYETSLKRKRFFNWIWISTSLGAWLVYHLGKERRIKEANPLLDAWRDFKCFGYSGFSGAQSPVNKQTPLIQLERNGIHWRNGWTDTGICYGVRHIVARTHHQGEAGSCFAPMAFLQILHRGALQSWMVEWTHR